jgi:hypothetical protein
VSGAAASTAPGERSARFVLRLNVAILLAIVGALVAAVAWVWWWWVAFPPHRVQVGCATTNAGWTAYERVVDYALPPRTISTIRLTRDLDGDPMGTCVGRLHYGPYSSASIGSTRATCACAPTPSPSIPNAR